MTANNSSDDRLDSWLEAQFTAFVHDLTGTVDIQAGFAEAIQSSRFTELVTDLDGLLNLGAGLAAILPTTPSSDPSPAAPSAAHDDAQPRSWATRYAAMFTSLDAPTRLGLRTHPLHAALRSSVGLLTELDPVARRAQTLTEALRARAHARAHDLTRDLARDLDLARDRARDLDRDLARARARDRDRDLALDRDRALDRALARAHARAHDLARGLARDLDLARARDRDLDRALDRARALAHDLAHDLDLARARALDLARALARDLARDLVHENLDARSADPTSLLGLRDVLDQVADDFIGADLRSASLDGVSLEGIRWSTATRWPADWEERIRAGSFELEPGVFEIGGRGRSVSVTA